MISFNETKEILEPHLAAFYQVPNEAWSDYLDIPEKTRLVFSRRTRASAVHDYMISRAAKYAESVDGVRLFNLNMLYGLIIENIAIRFKKFDESNLSSNQLTKQVINFRNQCQLEGIKAIHNLEVGYSLDKNEMKISQVTLACPSGIKNNLWEIEINEFKPLELVIDLFHEYQEEDIQPAKIKPKKKGEVIPIKKVVGEQRDNDNSQENKW